MPEADVQLRAGCHRTDEEKHHLAKKGVDTGCEGYAPGRSRKLLTVPLAGAGSTKTSEQPSTAGFQDVSDCD